MPQPRKPTSILQLKGAFAHNPDRGRERENEPEPVGEIGEPPEHMGAEAAACWREIVSLSHKGTLCASDRLLLEHGAEILALLRQEKWVVPPAIMVRFEYMLGKFGMTPADRSRVSVAKTKPVADPIDEFRTAA